MFFNRNYIPAVPIREEQRLSEEEELARQLKREARIFFPDRKLPDFDTPDLSQRAAGSGYRTVVGFGLWTEVADSGKRTRKTKAGTA